MGKSRMVQETEWFNTSPSEIENLYQNCGTANEQTLVRDRGEDNLGENN